MNKVRLLAGVWVGILVLAAVAGALFLRQLQTYQQLTLRPMTQQMQQLAQPLNALELLQSPVKSSWYSRDGLYNLTYYPQASTVAGSFYLQDLSSVPSFYLVDCAEEKYDGWYIPTQTKLGVYKIFFEDLPKDIIPQKLLCVYHKPGENPVCKEFLLS